MSEKKKFVKIQRGRNFYIQPIEAVHNAIDGEICDARPYEPFTVMVIEMSQEQYDILPEFTGW